MYSRSIKKFSRKVKLPVCILVILIAFGCTAAYASAPVVTYATPQVYTVGTAITPLSPSNSGGSVGVYAAPGAFAALTTPSDIAVNSGGNIFALSYSLNTLTAYNSSGTIITTAYPTTGYNGPESLVFDGLGNLYVSNSLGNTVRKITSAGVSTTIAVTNPLGLAVDASNNVYVASGSTGNIYEIAAGAGTATSFLTGFSSPYGVAVNSSGDLFVSQTSDNTVYKIAYGTSTHVSFATGFSAPKNLIVDGSGNLYVADYNNGAVKSVTPAGNITTVTSTAGSEPTGEAFDATGALYGTSYGFNFISKSALTSAYSISPALPAGLSFNTITGVVSGTPTALSAAANYTITANNASGTSTTTLNITVVPVAPSAAATSACGSGTQTITASGGLPAGGTYSWYNVATGGTALQSSTSTTYSPYVTASTTYYVSYTSGGTTSSRRAVTATVNPIVTSPITGATFSYPFNGNANDISGNNDAGIVGGATLTADRFGAVSSAYNFNGSSNYITTTTALTSPTVFSISLWFNTTVGGGKLIGFGASQTGASATYDRHIYMTATGQLSFGLFDSGFDYITTTNSYNDGNWHHVIVTVGSGGSTLYVDGTAQASKSTMIPSVNYTGYWRIGYDNISTSFYPNASSNPYFTGNLDDIAVFNRVLTAAEITSSNNIYQIAQSTIAPCAGSPISFAAPLITGATYTWTDPLGNTQTGQNPTFTSALSGNYSLTVTGGPGGCSSTATIVPTISARPVISQYPSTATGNYISSYPFTGNANDVSGNGNNGTPQNAPVLTTDRYGAANSAYSFNGTSQYISTTTAYTAPSTYSMSVWFNTTGTTGGELIGFGNAKTGTSSTADRNIYMNNSGQLYFGINSSSFAPTINTTTSYNDGNWHNVVATFAPGTGMKIYVDGALITYNTTFTTDISYTGYWKIGGDNLNGYNSTPSSYYFGGLIDDVTIYNREVTAAEVYTLNGAGSVPFCPNGTLTLQANTVSGATYAWTGPGGFTSTLQNPTIASATAANVGTYTVTVTNAGGCSSQVTATTVLSSVPTSTFSLPAAVYPGSSAYITYSGTDPSTSTFTWNFGGGTVVSGSGIGPYKVQWSSAGTQTVTLTVTNANGCSSSTTTHTISVNSTSWYSTYVYRKKITMDATKVSGTSTLANFPVLLKIVDPDLIYTAGSCTNKIQSAALNDLAFVDGASPQSNELPYQIDTYNAATGTLLVWVQQASISSAGDGTTIYYYYGSNAPPAHLASTSTWGSDYKAVYHFNESTFSSATGAVKESTTNAFNATTGGMTATNLTSGQIGNAYTFANSLISTGSNLDVLGDHTISAWVNTNNTGIDEKVMTDQNNSNKLGYKLGSYYGTLESESVTAGASYSLTRGSTPSVNLAANTWYYVQGVVSGNQLSVYLNGVQYATTTITVGTNTAASTFYIGVGESGNLYYWSGLIDEVRVSTVAKTTDWLKTEYNNQVNPSNSGTAPFISSIANIEYSSTNYAAGYSPGSLIYTWTGTSGTSVATAANWNITSVTPNVTGSAPTGTYATINIPAGASAYPSLTGTLAVYSLTLGNGAQLNLNGNSLFVGCDIINNAGGQILYGGNAASGITWNGSLATQNYYGSTTAATGQTGNMTVNNTAAGTVSIGSGNLDVYGTVTLTKGNLTIVSPSVFTLKSLATQTAGVAAIPSGSTITGTVAVERYLAGGSGYRGYRLLSSPVSAGAVAGNNVYSINYLKNSAYLTGNASGGFDKTGNPTLYLYREDQTPSNASYTSGAFWGISAINNATAYNYYLNNGSTAYNIPVGDGYLFFFRGNRASTTVAAETVTTYVPVSATLNTSGTLTQGQVVVHDWYTPGSANLGYTGTGTGTNYAIRGFNLVGNPYASSIDWEQYNTSSTTTGIYASNVATTIYELNPATNNYDTYQKGGTHTNHGSNIIASGQGFFVQASSSASPQLIFNETAKTASQNTGLNLFMATGADVATLNNATVDQHLRLQLAKDTINNDDIYIGFRETASTKNVLNEDAPYKKGNGQVSLSSISADTVALAINRMPLPKQSQVIPLSVSASTDGIYQLNRTEMEAIPGIYEIWLKDAYTKDSLDMRANTTYAFNLYHADTNSYGNHRFSLIIRQNPALGLHLLSFAAAKSGTDAAISWKVENEANYTNFTVERSTDNGKTFQVLDGFLSSSQGTYSYTDNSPATGDEYRLKLEDLNGSITYSAIVTLGYGNLTSNIAINNISVYPNPTNGMINMAIRQSSTAGGSTSSGAQTLQAASSLSPAAAAATTAATSYDIKIVSITGSVIKTSTSANPVWQANVSNLSPGTYVIRVINHQNNSVIGTSTFVKL